jgi:hypothetical protein
MSIGINSRGINSGMISETYWIDVLGKVAVVTYYY